MFANRLLPCSPVPRILPTLSAGTDALFHALRRRSSIKIILMLAELLGITHVFSIIDPIRRAGHRIAKIQNASRETPFQSTP